MLSNRRDRMEARHKRAKMKIMYDALQITQTAFKIRICAIYSAILNTYCKYSNKNIIGLSHSLARIMAGYFHFLEQLPLDLLGLQSCSIHLKLLHFLPCWLALLRCWGLSAECRSQMTARSLIPLLHPLNLQSWVCLHRLSDSRVALISVYRTWLLLCHPFPVSHHA